METEAELFYHELETVNHAAGGLGEPSTIKARDDLEDHWNRRYGTAKGGNQE
jgi:hypothetical protein